LTTTVIVSRSITSIPVAALKQIVGVEKYEEKWRKERKNTIDVRLDLSKIVERREKC
jgi:hypothetical protein